MKLAPTSGMRLACRQSISATIGLSTCVRLARRRPVERSRVSSGVRWASKKPHCFTEDGPPEETAEAWDKLAKEIMEVKKAANGGSMSEAKGEDKVHTEEGDVNRQTEGAVESEENKVGSTRDETPKIQTEGTVQHQEAEPIPNEDVEEILGREGLEEAIRHGEGEAEMRDLEAEDAILNEDMHDALRKKEFYEHYEQHLKGGQPDSEWKDDGWEGEMRSEWETEEWKEEWKEDERQATPEWLESDLPYKWSKSAKTRFHAHTLDGKFVGIPRQIQMPEIGFLAPLRCLFSERWSMNRLRETAEYHYGGRGLPYSLSPRYLGNSSEGHGLLAENSRLSARDADVFLAVHLPPAYCSIYAVLCETRRRLGPDWIQSRLKQGQAGALNVLDAGGAGAGIAAWNEMCRAEWSLLEDQDEVTGQRPRGKETVLAGSMSVRQRLQRIVPHATYMSELPNYEHSGAMRGQRLDGRDQPLPRRKYHVVIASHNFVQNKEQWRRRDIFDKLWDLVDENGGILILVERGDPRGAQVIGELRDLLLREVLLPHKESEPRAEILNDADGKRPREREVGHLVAPCTNHTRCPLWMKNAKPGKDFCHFSYRFWMPAFYRNLIGLRAQNAKLISGGGDVKFSYLVVQRGVPRRSSLSGKEATERAMRGYDDAAEPLDAQTLPRVILPPIKRKGHICLDVCTPEGQIRRWTVPKSFGQQAFHDVRKASWGDLWALGAKTEVSRKLRLGGKVIKVDKRRRRARQGSRLEGRQLVSEALDAPFRDESEGDMADEAQDADEE